MKPRIQTLSTLTRLSRPLSAPSIARPIQIRCPTIRNLASGQFRSFASSSRLRLQEKNQYDYSSPNARPAAELDHNVTKEEQNDYDRRLQESLKDKQIRHPWNREGSDKPPVARQRSAGAMTKGQSYYLCINV